MMNKPKDVPVGMPRIIKTSSAVPDRVSSSSLLQISFHSSSSIIEKDKLATGSPDGY